MRRTRTDNILRFIGIVAIIIILAITFWLFPLPKEHECKCVELEQDINNLRAAQLELSGQVAELMETKANKDE